MPRPRVRPEDRQRSTRACTLCKASKIRCDSQRPCASCVRRKRASSCAYTNIDRRRRSNASLDTAEIHHHGSPQSIHNLRSVTHAYSGSNVSPVSVATPSLSVDGDHAEPLQGFIPVGSNTDQVHPSATTPSLSFLYFLRKTLRPFVGPTSFTEDDHDFVAAQSDPALDESAAINYSAQNLYDLLDSFFEATNGLIDVFTADEIDALVTRRTTRVESHSSQTSAEDAGALDVALAIGAQVRPGSRNSSVSANGFLSRARQAAFVGMLANPSLSMVRLFILLGFFMLGACQRNAASMYIGISARAAVLLRLHQYDSVANLPAEQIHSRARMWNSLRVLDVLTGFIIGPCPGLPDVWLDLNTGQNTVTSARNPCSAFASVVEGSRLLEKVVQKLRSGKVLHVPTAEALLTDLRAWIHGLPPTARSLKIADKHNLTLSERQALIGNIHISCIYYFAVMLITRPFLVAYLLSRLRGRAPDHLIEDPEEANDMTLKNNIVSKLAQVCVSSATYMADMCWKAKQSGLSFGNLCLIKAWLFGSGLILGFSMFAGEPRKDIADAFEATLDVLRDIAETSPQAKFYQEILTKLSFAIIKYRQRVEGEVRRTVKHFMAQVLVLEPAEANARQSRAAQHHTTAQSTDSPSAFDENRATGNQEPSGMDISPQWEDFEFEFGSPDVARELEELEKLFYSVE